MSIYIYIYVYIYECLCVCLVPCHVDGSLVCFVRLTVLGLWSSMNLYWVLSADMIGRLGVVVDIVQCQHNTFNACDHCMLKFVFVALNSFWIPPHIDLSAVKRMAPSCGMKMIKTAMTAMKPKLMISNCSPMGDYNCDPHVARLMLLASCITWLIHIMYECCDDILSFCIEVHYCPQECCQTINLRLFVLQLYHSSKPYHMNLAIVCPLRGSSAAAFPSSCQGSPAVYRSLSP